MTHFVNSAARSTYGKMSLEALYEQRAHIEAHGRIAAKAVAAGDSEVETIAMQRGRWTPATRAEATLNSCRAAWKDITTIIREKEAAL